MGTDHVYRQKRNDRRSGVIRAMTIEDYDEVRSLWMTIRGFGIRLPSRTAGWPDPFFADMTEGGDACTMSAWLKNTECAESVRRWSYSA